MSEMLKTILFLFDVFVFLLIIKKNTFTLNKGVYKIIQHFHPTPQMEGQVKMSDSLISGLDIE